MDGDGDGVESVASEQKAAGPFSQGVPGGSGVAPTTPVRHLCAAHPPKIVHRPLVTPSPFTSSSSASSSTPRSPFVLFLLHLLLLLLHLLLLLLLLLDVTLIPLPPPPLPATMSLRARTPLQATEAADFAAPSGNPIDTSPLSQSLNQNQTTYGKFNEDFDASQRGSSILEGDGLRRSHSTASQKNLDQSGSVSRSGTLKKKGSLSRKSSLKRSSSRRSMRAGSIKGVSASDDAASPENHFSVFYTPVPTSGTPTEILANRFQGKKIGMSYDKEKTAVANDKPS